VFGRREHRSPLEQAVKFFAFDREVRRAKYLAGHPLGQKNRATLPIPELALGWVRSEKIRRKDILAFPNVKSLCLD
jgi:hypothetical protein